MAKEYSLNGYLGLVETGKCRQTGTRTSVYNADQAGIDDDAEYKWATVCEDHGTLILHESVSGAIRFRAYPTNWCEECVAIVNEKESK